MHKHSEYVFYNETLGSLTLKEVISHIKRFIDDDPDNIYSLVIGTDSHQKQEIDSTKSSLHVVTAIVIHRAGFGGRFFWKRKYVENIHTLRDKIYAETLESLDFAKIFVPEVKAVLSGKPYSYNLEIHVDVGEAGATREMIKEVVGMVTGMGYIARTKPYSFAASYVADKFT